MNKLTIETKFDIGNIVYGFPDKELHKLIIDRIEVSFVRFGKDYKGGINQCKISYLATTKDADNNFQHRFTEDQLFTEEELKNYVDNYFKDRKNS